MTFVVAIGAESVMPAVTVRVPPLKVYPPPLKVTCARLMVGTLLTTLLVGPVGKIAAAVQGQGPRAIERADARKPWRYDAAAIERDRAGRARAGQRRAAADRHRAGHHRAGHRPLAHEVRFDGRPIIAGESRIVDEQ